MYEDTKVSQLVINQLSEEKFKELLENDELDQNQLYMTDDRAGYTPPLLDFKWADHLLNDISWLRADTFSWHDGEMYKVAYNHLVSCMADATEETETIDGIEITYYLAQNKRKICLPDQEDKLQELYNATGVAWYYILDEDNTQFKLPRTKFGFTGLRDEVGGYVEPSVPNVAGTVQIYSGVYHNITDNITAPFAVKEGTGWKEGGGGSGAETKNGAVVEFDLSTANKTYKNLATVQPPATQTYLYFYVGNFEKEAIEQTAGITTETLNSKADSDLGNIPANYDYVVESQEPTAENGYTWYRKYKSGWVEQGGRTTTVAGQITPYTLPVVMANTEYTITATAHLMHTGNAAGVNFSAIDTTSFSAWSNIFGTTGYHAVPFSWFVSGMSAQ